MKYLIFLPILFSLNLQAQSKYLDNHSCNECHEKIYNEFQSSKHSEGYFTNELHRKIADKVSTKKYECARCHMPMANNIDDLMKGKARPDKSNKTHTDGISCYFCHTIAYVKKSHKFNLNIKARQAKNYKPTLYGRLTNPDVNNEHSSAKNPIYAKKVCMGCHSHKLNDNDATVFHAMGDKQNSESCIKCHMPEIAGGNEDFNKKVRKTHASHKFLGIHDKEFRKTGVDINISSKNQKLSILLTNKMTHPLIIQAARVKYLDIEIKRGDKIIWKNYQKNPSEDKQGYFTSKFFRNGKSIIIPATATKRVINNLEAKEKKELIYKIPNLKKGDNVTVSLFVQLAKTQCTKVIKLENKSLIKPLLIKKVSKIIGGNKTISIDKYPIYHYQIKN